MSFFIKLHFSNEKFFKIAFFKNVFFIFLKADRPVTIPHFNGDAACHNKIPQQPNHFPRGKIFENALFKTYISLKMYFLIAFFNKQKKYSKLQPVTIKFPNNTIIFQGQDI